MKFKPEVDYVQFLKDAAHCTGEITYESNEGDILNLKSQLSEYIFLAAFSSSSGRILPDGEVICHDPEDYQKLKKYLTK